MLVLHSQGAPSPSGRVRGPCTLDHTEIVTQITPPRAGISFTRIASLHRTNAASPAPFCCSSVVVVLISPTGICRFFHLLTTQSTPSPILKLCTLKISDTMQLLRLHGLCIDRDQHQDHREEQHDAVLRKHVGPSSVRLDRLRQSTHLNTKSGLMNQTLNLRHCGSF